MAKHRAAEQPVQEAPADRTGISARVLIFLGVAMAVFVSGVVWAVTGPSRVLSTAPPGGPSPVGPGLPTGAPATQPAGAGVGASVVTIGSAVPRQVANRSASPAPSTSDGTSRPPSPSPSPPRRPGALTVSVASANSWPGGYGANYTITNGTGAPVNGWTVVLTFSVTVSGQAWNAQPANFRGTSVTLRSVSYNSALAAGQSAGFGLQANGDAGVTPKPVGCTVNGLPCSG